MSERIMLTANINTIPNSIVLDKSHALRSCTASDCEALGKLYFHAYEVGEACESEEAAINDIKNSFEGEYGKFWYECSKVIEYNNKIIGAILVVYKNSWDDSITCPYIIELFICREYRGKGLAKNLIVSCCNEMRKAKKEKVALTVVANNNSARQLYKSLGFTENEI